MEKQKCYRIWLTGIVQGVGFRPFVYRLAQNLRLSGYVLNNTAGVEILILGDRLSVELFRTRLQLEAPLQAEIDSLVVEEISCCEEYRGFEIRHSTPLPGRRVRISPDLPLCAECLRELFDPADRRYYYPYINCTHCGPRYTIIKGAPYDRPLTSMVSFVMCDECSDEYHNPEQRRFHAQPDACHRCGPHLSLLTSEGKVLARPRSPSAYREFFTQLGELLTRGKILALKGIGGYHLVCRATDQMAVGDLRSRKFREDKPFALMCRDLVQVRKYVVCPDEQAALLTSAARPIVLLARRQLALSPAEGSTGGKHHTDAAPVSTPAEGIAATIAGEGTPLGVAEIAPLGAAENAPDGAAEIAPLGTAQNAPDGAAKNAPDGAAKNAPDGAADIASAVAPGNRYLGIMLPYAPVHHLLFAHVDFPLVMTSANVAEEPIAYRDEEARSQLEGLCDYFIPGGREIFIRCDDTVTRVFRGAAYPLRRSRGMVPAPVVLAEELCCAVLGLGGEQKNTICLAQGRQAFLSQHLGDLKNLPAFTAFKDAVGHLQALLDIRPEALAYDLHPGYLASRLALEPPLEFAALRSLPKIGVQHHHAHVASCLAENRISEPAIGIALDGTGYGTDATIWGGEVFVVRDYTFSREFSLALMRMPGGELAIRKPWRMAAACLYELFGNDWREHLPPGWEALPDLPLAMTAYQLVRGPAPLTSSCGRLFDAAAALAGVRLEAHYEGQAAIELEQICTTLWVKGRQPGAGYPFVVGERSEGDCRRLLWQPALMALLSDTAAGVSPGEISARFHRGLVDILLKTCHILREEQGLACVALSGGCFMNMILLESLCRDLEADGFTVYIHHHVPCNDGGLSLGQVVMANRMLRSR